MTADVMFSAATDVDTAAIVGLRHRIWGTTYRGIYPDQMLDDFAWDWHHEQELWRLHDPKYAVYLIQKERQNIGYLAIHRGDVVTLQSLYIVSEYQQQGIGRCAFDLVAAYCREHGVSSFVCHCVPQNHNARKFYERMGGVVIGEDLGNEESWQDSILYRFTLA